MSVEIDALRVQVSDYESRLASLELLLQEKNKELLNYKQVSTLRNATSVRFHQFTVFLTLTIGLALDVFLTFVCELLVW